MTNTRRAIVRTVAGQPTSAGRGIVHSEMPEQEDGLMWGFQLWVNLPARDKMGPPAYQDIDPERIPQVSPSAGVTIRVVAGQAGGASGPVDAPATQPVYLDIALDQGASHEQALPAGHNAFVYVYEGSIAIGDKTVAHGGLGVLGEGAVVDAAAQGGPARFLLVAGRPLGEPVVKYGPFVMNTQQEIRQAIADFQAGRF